LYFSSLGACKFSALTLIKSWLNILSFHHLFLDKYETVSENPYFYLWVMASVLSSCYAYTWDIKMDWGLFDKKAGDNKYLREEIVYSSTVSNGY